jgi:hypothetical protein
MAVEEWALIASVAFAGLWSGLLAMLTLVLHPLMKEMDGAGFTRFLDGFLPIARKSWFNYGCVLGLVFAPAIALWTLDSDSTAFTLTVLGFACTVIGPLAVSNRLASKNYDEILSWKAEALPDGWEQAQGRYYAYNWIRATLTWAAFGLFLAALVELLG